MYGIVPVLIIVGIAQKEAWPGTVSPKRKLKVSLMAKSDKLEEIVADLVRSTAQEARGGWEWLGRPRGGFPEEKAIKALTKLIQSEKREARRDFVKKLIANFGTKDKWYLITPEVLMEALKDET